MIILYYSFFYFIIFYFIDIINHFFFNKQYFFHFFFCCENYFSIIFYLNIFFLLILVGSTFFTRIYLNIINFYKLILLFFFFTLILSIYLIMSFYNINFNYQIEQDFYNYNETNFFDLFSIVFLFLTNFLMCLSLLASWGYIKFGKLEFIICLLILHFFLTLLFYTSNLFVFFLSFETTLIPLYYMILKWGNRERRIHAAYQLYLYTSTGTIFLFLAISYIYVFYHSCEFSIINSMSTFSYLENICLWFSFMLGFAVKMPIFPFHLWLTEAHVEAPTAGSILLAGILLKLSFYGIIKIVFVFFDEINLYFQDLIILISIISIIYTCLATFIQTDIKKIIAYSSIGHMSFINIGIFIDNFYGFLGSFFGMLAHSFVSPALFLCVGILIERFHNKTIIYYYKLALIMPCFCIFFCLFALSNVNFPGSLGFYGEVLILYSIVNYNILYGFFSVLLSLFSVIYMFFLFVRLLVENYNFSFSKIIINFSDLNFREIYLLSCLLFIIVFYGINNQFDISFILYSIFNKRWNLE